MVFGFSLCFYLDGVISIEMGVFFSLGEACFSLPPVLRGRGCECKKRPVEGVEREGCFEAPEAFFSLQPIAPVCSLAGPLG